MIVSTFASRVNQSVAGDAACLLSLPSTIATEQEAITELAGRICYRSTEKMGHAPGFLRARMAEGHLDIFEHVWITAVLMDEDETANWMQEHRYVWLTRNGQWCYISANMRVWMELAKINLIARDVLHQYLPKQIDGTIHATATDVQPEQSEIINMPQAKVADGALVNLVACHRPKLPGGDDISSHQAATFLLQHVSRSLTHQLVRHRLLSFSQESQRYVSLEKGNWHPVLTPSIAESYRAVQITNQVWQAIETGYKELRALGILREDARYLLPNATSTTIMVSGSIAAWKFMLKQRCAPDAQWEIRNVALAIRDMLSELGMYHD